MSSEQPQPQATTTDSKTPANPQKRILVAVGLVVVSLVVLVGGYNLYGWMTPEKEVTVSKPPQDLTTPADDKPAPTSDEKPAEQTKAEEEKKDEGNKQAEKADDSDKKVEPPAQPATPTGRLDQVKERAGLIVTKLRTDRKTQIIAAVVTVVTVAALVTVGWLVYQSVSADNGIINDLVNPVDTVPAKSAEELALERIEARNDRMIGAGVSFGSCLFIGAGLLLLLLFGYKAYREEIVALHGVEITMAKKLWTKVSANWMWLVAGLVALVAGVAGVAAGEVFLNNTTLLSYLLGGLAGIAGVAFVLALSGKGFKFMEKTGIKVGAGLLTGLMIAAWGVITIVMPLLMPDALPQMDHVI